MHVCKPSCLIGLCIGKQQFLMLELITRVLWHVAGYSISQRFMYTWLDQQHGYGML